MPSLVYALRSPFHFLSRSRFVWLIWHERLAPPPFFYRLPRGLFCSFSPPSLPLISPILQEKVIADRETALLKEQELYNRLRNKDYGPAIALALELKRPQKLWGVLRDAMTEGMGEGVPGAAGEESECKAAPQWCTPAERRNSSSCSTFELSGVDT